MRLIATMGASGINQEHEYSVNGKNYPSELSFMALAKAYAITDIIVIGTEKSKNSIQPILDKNPNIEMVVIESDSVEDVFQKSLEYFSNETILDLTQGYRHYPMLTLLASVFLQNSASKNIKDIFYAQIIDENCQSFKNGCKYTFISLTKYLDIANMARIIETFNKTLITLNYSVHSADFKKLKNGMDKLTTELFSNNFDNSKKEAKKTENIIDTILEDKSLSVVEEHLCNLQLELQAIQNLTRSKESQTLLHVSEYFLKKNILLHAVTLLYEAMVAFLDEKIKNHFDCLKCLQEQDTYKRRNCLKKCFIDCRKTPHKSICSDIRNITNCQQFSEKLCEIDRLRNLSAHAHATGTHQENLKTKLEEAIKVLKPIMTN